MIVVAIIGILAAIAIPNFVKFQCRSKQSEAKGNMKALYVAEESYRSEFDTYLAIATPGTAASDVGFAPKGNKIRYDYSAGAITQNAFLGKADVNATFAGELGADQWTISQANDITDVTNGCK
jgi:type IV pilus assembly protein PilA